MTNENLTNFTVIMLHKLTFVELKQYSMVKVMIIVPL